MQNRVEWNTITKKTVEFDASLIKLGDIVEVMCVENNRKCRGFIVNIGPKLVIMAHYDPSTSANVSTLGVFASEIENGAVCIRKIE